MAYSLSKICTSLIDMWVRMINMTFVLRSVHCSGNQLIWGYLQASKLTAFWLYSGALKMECSIAT